MQAGHYTKIVGQCNMYLYYVAVKNLLIVNVDHWLHSTTNKQYITTNVIWFQSKWLFCQFLLMKQLKSLNMSRNDSFDIIFKS